MMIGKYNSGEEPFEEWMRSHGYTVKQINEVYKIVDDLILELPIKLGIKNL